MQSLNSLKLLVQGQWFFKKQILKIINISDFAILFNNFVTIYGQKLPFVNKTH